MKSYDIAVIEGDGIGPEITQAAMRVMNRIGEICGYDFSFIHVLAGGCAIDAFGEPLPRETVMVCRHADSVLLGRSAAPSGIPCPATCGRSARCWVSARRWAFTPTSAPPGSCRS